MELLLNPNIAYLILLGAISLSLLAIATPGTGVFEIGALFCFLISGFAAYRLGVHWWALVILLLSVIPFGVAVKTAHKLFLALSILLLVIGSVFLFAPEGGWISVNPVVALLASGALAWFFWFVAIKFLQTLTTRPVHDLDALIGQAGEARTAIHNEGSAYVNGELWSAHSESKIPKGSHIRVVRRDGFALLVEKTE